MPVSRLFHMPGGKLSPFAFLRVLNGLFHMHVGQAPGAEFTVAIFVIIYNFAVLEVIMIEKDYRTKGTCSKSIHLEIDDDGVIKQVSFVGGCPGNTVGVSKLVEGRKASEVVQLLKGTKCGVRPTSCPDQLALAIEEALA